MSPSRRHHHGLLRRALALAFATSLVATACGGDDDASSSTAADAATTAAPVTTAAASTTGAPASTGDSTIPDTAAATTAAPTTDDVGPLGPTIAPGEYEPYKLRLHKSAQWDPGVGSGFFSAVENGYFDAQGIIPETIVASGSATGVAAIVSGAADLAQTTPENIVNAIAQGEDLVAVWQWIAPGPVSQIVANGSAGIASIADLKGKRIGVTSMGSTTLFNAQIELARVGLTLDDVEIVNIGCCSAQYTALESGEVDAIGIWDSGWLPIEAQAKADGKQAWLDQLVWFYNKEYLSDVWVTTADFLAEHEDVVVRFLTALRAGQIYQGEHPEEALANAAANIDTIDASNPISLETTKIRSQTYVMDGHFDLDRIASSLQEYYDIGLVSMTPDQLDLEHIFNNDVPLKVLANFS